LASAVSEIHLDLTEWSSHEADSLTFLSVFWQAAQNRNLTALHLDLFHLAAGSPIFVFLRHLSLSTRGLPIKRLSLAALHDYDYDSDGDGHDEEDGRLERFYQPDSYSWTALKNLSCLEEFMLYLSSASVSVDFSSALKIILTNLPPSIISIDVSVKRQKWACGSSICLIFSFYLCSSRLILFSIAKKKTLFLRCSNTRDLLLWLILVF